EERIDNEISQSPGRFGAARRERAREGWNEGRGHCALGEQVAYQIGYAERDVEGVHLDAPAGTEECGKHHLAGDTEHAAGHGRHTDEPCRAGEPDAHRPGKVTGDVIKLRATDIRKREYHTTALHP